MTMMNTMRMPLPLLRRCMSRLPMQPPAFVLCAMLNRQVLPGLDEDTRARLAKRQYRIEVTDFGMTLFLTMTDGRFAVGDAHAQPDLHVSASSADFIRLAAREIDADTLFFSRRLLMQGDTELGLVVRNAIDAIDFDAMAGGHLVQSVLRAMSRFVTVVEKRVTQ